MKLTTKSRYAVMAMAELAKQDRPAADAVSTSATAPTPVLLATLASRQSLSTAYLEQLFAKLVRAGLVTGQRGPRGGYRLAKPSDAITIADIVHAVDEDTKATRCQSPTQGCLPGGERCLTHDLWAELSNHIDWFLSSMTLADVVGRQVQPIVAAIRQSASRSSSASTSSSPADLILEALS
jgi:Rrf2 family iron-sulfur cluster assembly transcriptional regulator